MSLKSIKDRVTSNKGKQIESPKDLIYIHHILMKEYGWIPFEEFKNLPNATVLNLLNCITEDKEREENEYEKMKIKGRKS